MSWCWLTGSASHGGVAGVRYAIYLLYVYEHQKTKPLALSVSKASLTALLWPQLAFCFSCRFVLLSLRLTVVFVLLQSKKRRCLLLVVEREARHGARLGREQLRDFVFFNV